ncbi:MAG: class A beta-lactamase-related serine hydrolase [Planctomycetota bacterium]|nr:MAG: class A beta-lactamase-related serine hydrolase [Planctomycetota bacterium]
MTHHRPAPSSDVDETPPDVFDAAAARRVLQRIRDLCRDDVLPAAALCAGTADELWGPFLFGRQTIAGTEPIRPDAIFLVASITKPLVAMALMKLIEAGQVTLSDRVERFVPEFGQNGKHAVQLRHLLTHTSGLPDQLPNNAELRRAGEPLERFIEEVCRVELEFPPGRGVRYQSMGFAMLAEVIRRVTGISCSDFVHRELLQPLRMHDSALGAPDDWFHGPHPVVERIVEIRTPQNGTGHEWVWNTEYWRRFGAPWGGLLTTPADLARFAQMMLRNGETDGRRILSPATVRAATRNQLEFFRDIPEPDRRCRPWGLGWRLNWPAHSANFGDLLDPSAFGHWGSTGTVLWIDPTVGVFCVILTSQPQDPDGRCLSLISNAVAAAINRMAVPSRG